MNVKYLNNEFWSGGGGVIVKWCMYNIEVQEKACIHLHALTYLFSRCTCAYKHTHCFAFVLSGLTCFMECDCISWNFMTWFSSCDTLETICEYCNDPCLSPAESLRFTNCDPLRNKDSLKYKRKMKSWICAFQWQLFQQFSSQYFRHKLECYRKCLWVKNWFSPVGEGKQHSSQRRREYSVFKLTSVSTVMRDIKKWGGEYVYYWMLHCHGTMKWNVEC